MRLFKLGLVLVFAGIILAVIAALLPLLLVAPETGGVSATGGGCVVVFFVPVCFGVGEQAHVALLLAIALAVVLVVVLLLFNAWITKTLREAGGAVAT